MLQSIDMPLLVILGIGAVLAHVALLVAARWVNVVFLAGAAFVLVSPMSVAVDLPGVEGLKWVRVYLAMLILVVYALAFRVVRIGPAGATFLLFLGFYTLAGIWSEVPVAAVKFKVMYAIVAVGGLLLAASVRSFADFHSGLRILTIAGLFYALLVMAGIAREPGQLLSGRLSVWGWNANRIGHDAAAALALCLFVGVYDRTKIWKLYALSLAGFFGFIILATGSRAATGMAAISAMIMLAPLFRRPVLLTTLAIIGGLAVNFFMQAVSSHALERIGEVDFSNRQMVWHHGLELFFENPATGAGWVFDTSVRGSAATANLHSIYVQILAETGLAGAALFGLTLVVCGIKSLKILNDVRKTPGSAPYAFFAFSLAGATLAHGMAESSTLQGTNLNGLLLPFALGMMDRVPRLIRDQAALQAEYDAAEEGDGEYGQYGEFEGYGEEPQTA